MTTSPTDRSISVGLLILRLGIGGYMLTHGWPKLLLVLDGNLAFAGDPIGLGPTLSSILVTLAEFACAVLVVIGLKTRLAAIPLVFAMAIAAFVAHGDDPWTMGEAARAFKAGEQQSWASKEPALLYLLPFLALALTGAGRFSIDALLRARRAKH